MAANTIALLCFTLNLFMFVLLDHESHSEILKINCKKLALTRLGICYRDKGNFLLHRKIGLFVGELMKNVWVQHDRHNPNAPLQELTELIEPSAR